MKAVVAAFNQEKALLGAFSVITNLRMDLFEALVVLHHDNNAAAAAHPVVDLVRVAVGVVVDAAAVVLELGASRVDTHTDRALGTNIYNAVSR